MDKFRAVLKVVTEDILWAIILVPILAISWLGFYTVARAVGVPVLFAAGMSAAFDGVAIFAARIGLKHRRKGFSGYLARIVVLAFVALGAFVQSYHGESTSWIQAHSWIVWAVAPVSAAVAYELHLGWAHRKQLIRMGYHHPSAKSGFGPATWLHFPRSTFHAYRDVLVARRTFIAKSNLSRFALQEAAQPLFQVQSVEKPTRVPELDIEDEVQDEPVLSIVPTRPAPRPAAQSRPAVQPRPAAQSKSQLRPQPKPQSRPKSSSARSASADKVVADWCTSHGYDLGFNGRVPIAGLRAYRAAHKSTSKVA